MIKSKTSNFYIQQIVEYRQFFIGEAPIDVDAILKQYDRSKLIRMAILMSHHYGNLFMPDSSRTLFSAASIKYIDHINSLYKNFCLSSGIPSGSKVVVSTFRTALELWRHIFAIRPNEFKNTIKEEDAEYYLFKVLLTLNEKVVYIKKDEKEYKLDELIFLNQFLTNDTNDFELQKAIQPQLYYVFRLATLCEQNEVMQKASQVLFQKWGITSWQEYVGTLMYLANQTDKYRKDRQTGVPIINLPKLKAGDETGLFSDTLIDALSINEEDFIPFDEPNEKPSAQNIDYRNFRSKPFIRFKEKGVYAVINNQLLCERIFNSRPLTTC